MTIKTDEIEQIRQQFPMLKKEMHGKPLIYFDSAATAQKPQCVIDAISNFYTNYYGTVHRAIYDLASETTHQYHCVREKAQRFLNAKETHEVIFTRGTTESINLIATSFSKAFMKPGDEIIISELEHHSNLVPWQMLCEEMGTKLRIIPANDAGELDLDVYQDLLNDKTKLVAVGHISNALGTIHPIKKMAEMAHDAGAKILIDGAQGAPHLPLDVQDLDVDFYVFSGHKTYGPTGIGIMYGKEDLLNQMPPYQGGGDMIESVTLERAVYNKLPMKFEAGTPMIAEVFGMGAAFDFLEKIGMANIHQWDQYLIERLTQKLTELEEVRIIGTAREKSSIVSFVIDGAHHMDVGTFLDLKGVAVRTGHHCAQPTMQRYQVKGTVRVSLGLYNTPDEIDRFVEILQEVVKTLR